MRPMLLAIAMLLAIGPLLLAAPGKAHACSCQVISGDPGYVARMVDDADAIVIGEVAEVHAVEDARWPEATVNVVRAYKGAGADRFVARFGDTNGCGYPGGEAGSLHLFTLYDRDDETHYSPSYCSSFRLPADSDVDQMSTRHREFLQELERQTASLLGDDGYWQYALAAGIVALSLAGLALAWRLRRAQA